MPRGREAAVRFRRRLLQNIWIESCSNFIFSKDEQKPGVHMDRFRCIPSREKIGDCTVCHVRRLVGALFATLRNCTVLCFCTIIVQCRKESMLPTEAAESRVICDVAVQVWRSQKMLSKQVVHHFPSLRFRTPYPW